VKRALTWDDTEDIALALAAKYPQQNPLAMRFTDLHRYILGLDGFTGDPGASSEGKLEAIQMAWHEEWQDAQSG
jgi:FeS assembly protein IscX